MATVLEKQQVRVRPTGAALAADIEGVDLAGPLSPETMAAIKAAWAIIWCCASAASISATTI